MQFKLWLESTARKCMLKISKPNEKIPHWNFNLPAGFTCPFAKNCLSKAERKTGKITDAPGIDFRCYAASQESTYPSVRTSRWDNFEALKAIGFTDVDGMAQAIMDAIHYTLPRSEHIFRLHVGGDFFNKYYLQAWIKVAKNNPEIKFYTYTKSIPYLIENLPLPENLLVTVSKGGKYDDLIQKHNLKFSVVAMSEKEAEEYVWTDASGETHTGLEIDHDDSHAWKDDKPFALLIHGVQPAGSEAGKAVRELGGKGSYGKASREKLKKIELQQMEPE